MGCTASSHQVINSPYDLPSRRTFSVNETLPHTFVHMHTKREFRYDQLCRQKFQSRIATI